MTEEQKKEHPVNQWYQERILIRREAFETLLPAHISFEKYAEVIKSALIKNPELVRVQDQTSLYSACLECAQDGLFPNGKEAVLLIFKAKIKSDGMEKYITKAQYIPMIAGILKKIRNSGELASISAHVAYKNDWFEYFLGDNEAIHHKPALENRGEPICVYSILKTKDGAIYRELMPVEDIEKIRKSSKQKDGIPWVHHWDEMAKKTVIKRLAKRAPISEEVDRVLNRENEDYPVITDNVQTTNRLTKFNPEDFNQTLIPLNAEDLSVEDKAKFDTIKINPSNIVLGIKSDVNAGELKPDFFDE